MTEPTQFAELFHRLGLDELDADATCDATFVPVPDAQGRSAPRAPAAEAALSGTLPRLLLESPRAARLEPAATELEALHVLGEGGMGRVLLARQGSLGRDVAVKVLRPGAVSEAAAEVLIHEARTTGALEHPSVVPVYALACDGSGQPAVVMKRVEGVPWRELIHDARHPFWARAARGRDPISFHVEVLVQVCNAVAHAHQRGVLHRDVKPANVLLGDLGEVYLADWGVALKKAEAAATPVRLVGTPAYLAPEMVTGDARLVDERTDVYLVGATLYEVLTHAPPHVGTSLREVMQHAFECPEPQLFPDAPPLLAAVCRRAMAADPSKRFASATALRDELQRFLQHRGASALAAAASRRLQELEAMGAAAADTAEQRRRWHVLLSECRFGFQQALESSPDHDGAREGLRRCLEVAARHELERGAAAAAAAHLAELEHPPAELVSALQRLEEQERERLKAHAEMERLSHELSLDVASRHRTAVTLGMAGLILVIVGAMAAVNRERMAAAYDTGFRMVPLAVTALGWSAAALLWRKALFSNRINRQVMGLMGVGIFGALVQRGFSLVFDISTPAAVTQNGVLFAALAAFATMTVHRSFFAPALCFLAGPVAVGFWPQYAVALFGFASAVGVALASIAVWRARKEPPLA